MSGTSDFSRRQLLGMGVGLLASSGAALAAPSTGLKVSVFSKHLHFLQGAELVKATADLGFDGLDLTVRKGGHVAPESAATELPKLVALIRQGGLEVPMITSDIVDADSPNAEAILKTCAELGIPDYRWGGFKYDTNVPILEQLNSLRPRVAKLQALNQKYKVRAMYHTHSGIGQVGASFWDLRHLLQGFDPKAVAINFDIGHATIEGGYGGWINSFRVCEDYLAGIALKDFSWGKDKNGKWKALWQPIGQGMVQFPQFFGMMKKANFKGPLQVHYEYPLGGADTGKAQLTGSKDEVYAAMKRDLALVRKYMADSGF